MIPVGSPIVIALINIVLMIFFFRDEPIEFLVLKGELSQEKAISAIKKVYRSENNDELDVIY